MPPTKPICFDLFCGLGGWTEGFLAEGYDCVGFDIERHDYGTGGYPGKFVQRDIRTLHGSELADATIIVASPPCQEFSYMAMPWSRAKQIEKALQGEGEFPVGYKGSRTTAELTSLFQECFRIQREASAAAGRHIPMIVENVRGARKWVGKSQANYGSFYLWGDVPEGMLMARLEGTSQYAEGRKVPGFRFDRSGRSFQTASVEGIKQTGISGLRNNGKGDRWFQDGAARSGSKPSARKAASAMIAKIPLPLSTYISRYYHPDRNPSSDVPAE